MKVFVVLAALIVGGCMLLQHLGNEPTWPYDKIPVAPGESIPDTVVGHAGERERDKYRCLGGRAMYCESFGVVMECRCTP